MKIIILHNAASEAEAAGQRDVLAQVDAVEQVLQGLGHQTYRLACTLNLEAAEEVLVRDRPDLVFNLVESLGGSDRLAHLAAVLLEGLDIPYTGTPATVFHLTNNKPLAKQQLVAASLPTPPHLLLESASGTLASPYIIKAVWENASVGLDDHAVIQTGDGSTVHDQIASRSRQLGYACFAEQFIDGREFNLSLLATPDGPRVLPPAEIDFREFPADRPKIVGYAAKRGDGTIEYLKTPRTFDFAESDRELLDRLSALALQCWQHFGLAGYASIDFRIDQHGQPWILEINANPRLAHDSGFVAALNHAGISLPQALESIITAALRPLQSPPAPSLPTPPPPTHHSPLTYSPTNHSPTNHSPPPTLKLRTKPKRTDAATIRTLLTSVGLFRDPEIDSAVELLQGRLKKGSTSTAEFIFAEEKKSVVGYICFGKNPTTSSGFHIHWLAVDPPQQRRAIGHTLLAEAERQMAASGGTRIYLNTSLRSDFQATREFYEQRGYQLVAVLDDFYAPGDSQATYVKTIEPLTPPTT